MENQKKFNLNDIVTVFDQQGEITAVIDETRKPHLYQVTFDATGKAYIIEAEHIEADNRDVTERIKTFEDAVRELGEDHNLVKQFRLYEEQMNGCYDEMHDLAAYLKLRIITEALNEGWHPNFWNEEEMKFWPWHYTLTEDEYNRLNEEGKQTRTCRVVGRSDNGANALGGLVFASAYSASADTHAYYGYRLAFKSRELALYAGKQFKELYADFKF